MNRPVKNLFRLIPLSLFTIATLFLTSSDSHCMEPVTDILISRTPGSARFSVTHNSRFYFVTSSQLNVLWQSDGTDAGTKPVISLEGDVTFLSSQAGIILITTKDDRFRHFWKSDGTSQGTILLKSVPISSYNFWENQAALNGAIYFTGDDAEHGIEPWKGNATTGTSALLADIKPGNGMSQARSFTACNGSVYFTASGDLWKTNGSAAGTVQLSDSPDMPVDNILLCSGNKIYFSTWNNSAWHLAVSNGTPAGTKLLKQFSSIPTSPYYWADVNGTAYFTANDGETGTGYELWKSTGTPESTVQVKDIIPEAESSAPADLTNLNGTLYFTARSQNGLALWKSGGTTATTVKIKEGVKQEIAVMNGMIYFAVGNELWRTSGTVASTVLIHAYTYPYYLLRIVGSANGRLFLEVVEIKGNNDYTFILGSSNGTAAGTVEILPLTIGDGSITSNGTNGRPQGKTIFRENSLFFGGTVGLFRIDATGGSTIKSGSIEELTLSNNILFFRYRDSVNGSELWKSDGTEAGTGIVKDILPGSGDSSPAFLTDMNGNLFFFTAVIDASGTKYEYDLWKSRGTETDTEKIIPLGTSYPSHVNSMGGKLYFILHETTNRLWQSDGTLSGSLPITDDSQGSIMEAVSSTDKIFFTTSHDGNYELWSYDTQGNSTHILTAKLIEKLSLYDTGVVFAANDGTHGVEPWYSDGTTSGTRMIMDIRTGQEGSFPHNFTNVKTGDQVNAQHGLYFAADDGIHGNELWFSPSSLTANDTHLFKDIRPGPIGSSPSEITAVNNSTNSRVYFSANDGVNGTELWSSQEGIVEDMYPGLLGGLPSGMTLRASNNYLYLLGTDPKSGTELRKLDTQAVPPPVCSININDDATFTRSTATTLSLACSNATQMQFSSNGITWTAWETLIGEHPWTLAAGNGLRSVFARFKDSNSKISPVYGDSIYLDTTKPTGSVTINGVDRFTNSVNVTLGIKATDTGSSVSKMQVSNSSTVWPVAWEDYAETKNWTLLSGDGVKTVYVRFMDRAGTDIYPNDKNLNGNISPLFSDTITLDTAGPALTITPLPLTNNIGTSEKPVVITGTKELGSTITAISFNTTATVALTSNNKTLTTWSANVTGLEETANILTVTATDKALNPTPKSITIVYDKTPPLAVITGTPASPIKAGTYSLTVGGDQVVSYKARVTKAGVTGAWATLATAVATKISVICTLPGEYRVEVIGKDAAGNWQDIAAATLTSWTVDTTPPQTTLLDPKLAPRSNNKTPSFSFSSEDGATFGCKIDLAAYAPCTSPYTTAALKDGSHTFSVRARDIAGNYDAKPETYTWTVDTAGPALTITPLPLTNIDPSKTPINITGTKELGSTITGISFNTTATVVLTSNNKTLTTWSANVTGLEETANILTVIASDKGLLNTTEKSITIVYDKTPPLAVITGTPASPIKAGTYSLTVGGDQVVAYKARITKAGVTGAWATLATAVATKISVICTLPGEYRVEVIGRDTARNWQALDDATSVSWAVDTAPPQTTLLDPKPPLRSNNKTPSFSFSSEDGATFGCKIDLAAYAPCTSPYTTAALNDGSHTFSVRARDIAGNYDATPATYTWTVIP